MPTYNYKCESCGSETEQMRLMKDRNNKVNCHCGNECKRTIAAPSLSGFNNLGQSK